MLLGNAPSGLLGERLGGLRRRRDTSSSAVREAKEEENARTMYMSPGEASLPFSSISRIEALFQSFSVNV